MSKFLHLLFKLKDMVLQAHQLIVNGSIVKRLRDNIFTKIKVGSGISISIKPFIHYL